MGYLTNFIVYTMAMVGIIVVALLVFKHSSGVGCQKKSKFLKVEDAISIGARKTLYIITAGTERFLIAGDTDNTTLIAKLAEKNILNNATLSNEAKDFKDVLGTCSITENFNTSLKDKNSNLRESLRIYNSPKNSVIKNLADIMCKKTN